MTYKVLSVLFLIFVVLMESVEPTPFLGKLFGGYYGGYSYNYQPYNRPRSYGRSYGYEQQEQKPHDGGKKYLQICRVHAISSYPYPGRVGNPVC